MNNNHLRLLDANLNRLKEGIRVVEDIFRFLYDDKSMALRLKNLRHQSKLDGYYSLLESRNIKNDVLKKSTEDELKRDGTDGILISNFKRAQESARVLEEFLKLSSPEESGNFKKIRYELYDLEKALIKTTSNSK